MVKLDAETTRKIRQQGILIRHATDERRRLRPYEYYRPHERGQLQFHRSTHQIRSLFPGNGWGKTIAAANEVVAWALHLNRWQRTPDHPVNMVWFAKTAQQFGIQRELIETEVFGTVAQWQESKKRYVWPTGSKLHIGNADDATSWKRWQGINPDLIIFDEQPQLQLWREMAVRRRGKRDTRYILAMTATEGASWVEMEVYQPWRRHHLALGLDDARALVAQLHPTIFCWDRGGIDDNPGVTQGQIEWHHAQKWSSDKEREVRLRGGFQQFHGDGVFDPAAIRAILDRIDDLNETYGKGRIGYLRPVPKKTRRTGA